MLQIAITDDHTLFRKSLALLIASFGNMEVVLLAANGKELLNLLPTRKIDIVLLDIEMPKMDGFETVQLLRKNFPDIKIIILSFIEKIDTVKRMVELGVDGFFTKEANPLDLKKAILGAAADSVYLDPKIQRLFEQETASKITCKVRVSFTPREREIMLLSAKGHSGKEIAFRLFISLRTVEVHKKNLMVKTSSFNFISVIIYALLNNLLSLEELNSDVN